MNKVDWDKSPSGAEFYAYGLFRKAGGTWHFNKTGTSGEWKRSSRNEAFFVDVDDYEHKPEIIPVQPPILTAPVEWPEESRIDIIGQQGNTGEHYAKQKQASDFLTEGAAILTQRGQQYGSEGRECSFPEAAAAFNAITGNSLKGSDVCLILALVKQVRQYSQPERFHEDSAVDGINYLALQAELLKKERRL